MLGKDRVLRNPAFSAHLEVRDFLQQRRLGGIQIRIAGACGFKFLFGSGALSLSRLVRFVFAVEFLKHAR